MLNAADLQATERHFGYLDLKKNNKAWVLSRFVIEIEQMPMSYTNFDIHTWIESTMKYFTRRNWSISADDGTIYGYGTSVWAMIDLTSRQPVDILSVNDGVLQKYVESQRTVPIEAPSRVRMDEKGAILVKELDTTYNDIDVNGHVNSVKYIEHVLDLFPIDWYKNNFIHRLEVAYVAETRFGDKLRIYEDKQSNSQLCYKVTSLTNDTEQEVARLKIITTPQNK